MLIQIFHNLYTPELLTPETNEQNKKLKTGFTKEVCALAGDETYLLTSFLSRADSVLSYG
jgi:hypothetical protein